LADELGILGHERRIRFADRQDALSRARELAKSLTITPNLASRYELHLNHDGVRRSVYELLSYPNIGLEQLNRIWPELASIDAMTREALEIEAQYAVYL